MENCLVTKLKAAVQNDELLKIDEFIFDVDIDVNAPNLQRVVQPCNPYYIPTEGIPVSIIGDGNFTDWEGNSLGKFVTITSSMPTCLASPGRYRIKVGNKYKCNKLYSLLFTYVPLDTLKYSDFLEIGDTIARERQASDTRIIPPVNTTMFDVSNEVGNITINTSDFANALNMEHLYANGNFVSGNISDLSGLTKLSLFNLRYTNVTGTVESFVQGLRAAGKTSGTMSLQLYNDGITWKGIPTNQLEHTYAGTLSWTATTITYNEETITA